MQNRAGLQDQAPWIEQADEAHASGPDYNMRSSALRTCPSWTFSQLQTADKDPDGIDRNRIDLQWKDGIDGVPGHDVEESRSFTEPGITPRLDNRW
jgi:hypothetical protein